MYFGMYYILWYLRCTKTGTGDLVYIYVCHLVFVKGSIKPTFMKIILVHLNGIASFCRLMKAK